MAEHPWSSEAAHDRFRRAVQAVEERSAVEVVVAVRPQSASYPATALAVGAAAAYASLLFMLFAERVYPLGWIAVLVAVVFGLGAFGVIAVDPLRRLLTSSARQRLEVERAGRALFIERRIDATQGRTGVLVYLSGFERQVFVVADVGVVARVPAASWESAVARITAAVDERGFTEDGVEALAVAIESLGDTVEDVLPPASPNPDELEDVA